MQTGKSLVIFITILLSFTTSKAQPVKEPHPFSETWTNNYEPFRIAGNLYYVGTEDLGSFLITTPKGHILINTGLASSAATIKENIESLGFRFNDIKTLLVTHAHFDHVGAIAEIKKQTGAKLMVNVHDASVMADGGKSDYALGGDTSSFVPVQVDRVLKKESTIKLGGTKVTALHHPGHTKGATSFLVDIKDSSRTYRVLIANMPTIVFNGPFSELKTYPNAAEDFAYTLNSLKEQKFDLWLASHASQFDLHKKHKPGSAYNPMVFADREGYDKIISRLYKAYNDRLAGKDL